MTLSFFLSFFQTPAINRAHVNFRAPDHRFCVRSNLDAKIEERKERNKKEKKESLRSERERERERARKIMKHEGVKERT